MAKRTIAPGLAACSLLLSGCTPSGTERQPVSAPVTAGSEYSGHYNFGAYRNSFTPCSGSESWPVVGAQSESLTPVNEFVTRNYSEFRFYGRLFVRWRALVTQEDLLGHRGPSRLEVVKVLEVLEVRWPAPDDCGYVIDQVGGFKVGDRIRRKGAFQTHEGIVTSLIPEHEQLIVKVHEGGKRVPFVVTPSEIEHVR